MSCDNLICILPIRVILQFHAIYRSIEEISRNNTAIDDWTREGGWLFASYAAAEGLDNQSCEWVCHVGIPMNVEVIVQGNGRCARKPMSVGLAMFGYALHETKTAFCKATSEHRIESDFGFTSSDMTDGEKTSMDRVYSVIPTLDNAGCIREALLHHFEGTRALNTCPYVLSFMFLLLYSNRGPRKCSIQ
jgi:hypothetical protein